MAKYNPDNSVFLLKRGAESYKDFNWFGVLSSNLWERSFSSHSLTWCNSTTLVEKTKTFLLGESDWTSEKDFFSLYLLCLIGRRERTAKVTHGSEYWFQLNRGFHHPYHARRVFVDVKPVYCEDWPRVLRDFPLTGTLKVMRDLSHGINNCIFFLSFVPSTSNCKSTAVLMCCSDAPVCLLLPTVDLTTGQSSDLWQQHRSLTCKPGITRCFTSCHFVLFIHQCSKKYKIKYKHVFCITVHKLFVFKWIQFFARARPLRATLFHSFQWNPGDNQYDMPNNRTQWFEFNTLGSRITNVPVAKKSISSTPEGL